MGDPGNPTDPSGTPGPGPDPAQPGWASPTPPAPPPTWGSPPVPPVPAAPPAGTGWTPPPAAPRKRRLTWLWILIPVLGVFLVSVVLIIVFAVRAIVGPIEATNDYFALLRDERYATAYNERCESFQSQVTLEEFVQSHQANGPVRAYDIDSVDSGDDGTTTEGTVEQAGVEYDVIVHLDKEDGDWKVCEIEAERR